ncbi:hypothetical protein JMJ35_001399 [Cladonia borealis]|uniref:Heterokaryon incompatibility domain-containing protein n=1 Tax=Cladonia borealis TaxID=184061 RepID=A0AA39R9V3_9LECA|nr:hypothetical protein JMJ35_001399 [Cladonia borealis]
MDRQGPCQRDAPPKDSYNYKELTGEDEIRLLRLAHGEQTFAIEHQRVKDVPAYEALSYVWGDDSRRNEFYLADGTVLYLNDNLFEALQYLPQRCETEYLWIDQICIDQSNIKERNHQVKIMGNIYRHAYKVLIWMDADDSVARSLNDLWEDFRKEAKVTSRARLEEFVDSKRKVYLAEGESNIRNRLQNQVWHHPWFSRAWVFQELALSQRAVFVFGQTSTMFLTVVWISRAVYPLTYGTQKFDWHTAATMTAMDRMNRHWNHKDQHLLTIHFLSEMCPIYQASDPRDLIYAFMGLFSSKPSLHEYSSEREIQPNYALSYNSVLADVAAYFVSRGKGNCCIKKATNRCWLCQYGDRNALDILAHINRDLPVPSHGNATFRPSPETGLPSWAPDWKYSRSSWCYEANNANLRYGKPIPPRYQYNSFSPEVHPRLDAEHPRQLHVLGVCIHVIKQAGITIANEEWQYWKRWQVFVGGPYPNAEELGKVEWAGDITWGHSTIPGDKVCWLSRCSLPVILREVECGKHIVVETCYLPKTFPDPDKSTLINETFLLI